MIFAYVIHLIHTGAYQTLRGLFTREVLVALAANIIETRQWKRAYNKKNGILPNTLEPAQPMMLNASLVFFATTSEKIHNEAGTSGLIIHLQPLTGFLYFLITLNRNNMF